MMSAVSKNSAGIEAPPESGASEVRFIDPLHGSEWDDLVSMHPAAGFFHSSAWARVLNQTYGHLPLYFLLHISGKPAALVPIMEIRSPLTGCRGVCLPFTDFCAPLIFDGFKLHSVIKVLSTLAEKRLWRHFELRSNCELQTASSAAVSFFTHHLDLRGGIDHLFSLFHNSLRRSIRKAESSELQVRIRVDEECANIFFRLHTLTRRRHGLPPQPWAFFNNIYNEIIKPKLGFMVIATLRSIPVAGAVFFCNGKTAIYKFGASDELQSDLRANHIVMWNGIQFLVEQGVEILHFGRTAPNQNGLRRYKMNWGSVESILNYFRFGSRRMIWIKGSDSTSGVHNIAFSRFPLTLNRLLGSVIYPHLD